MIHKLAVNQFYKQQNKILLTTIFLVPLISSSVALPVRAITFNVRHNIKTLNTNHTVYQVAQVPKVQRLPANGVVKRYWNSKSQTILAPLNIYTRGTQHYFIKVVDSKSNKSAMTVFIHANKNAAIKLPIGTYKIKYATGKQWYGVKDLFGVNTAYNQVEKQLVFDVQGDKVRGYSLYLYPQVNGNLKTTPINRQQF
ncbi:hypothetical protein [Nostoc sp. CMAA1605]|uniref:hypothetical protein n=1 Tax=Nostoc sp. CMAA1605 TaxID=2055159 RepID=UPI001F441862|nr:hypothetical protein [Nostoc sp. CMAA1605]MCF4970580.1 hypothetical protein [Nostoc sp. CMAA1605]